MVIYPASLKSVGGARSGIAPVNLLDVQDVNGDIYYWADRACDAPPSITGGIAVPAEPPVALQADQYVSWALPTIATTNSQTEQSNGSATATKAGTAKLTMTFSCGLCNWWWGAYWKGFTAPSMPFGAVVSAIYPVMLATASGQGAGATAACGTNLDVTAMSPGGTFLNLPNSQVDEFQGEYFGASLGSDLAILGSQTLYARLGASTGTFFRELDVSFVGLAIYYTVPASNGRKGLYQPWLLDVPSFSLHRSLQTDTGSFVIQNLSGDSLSRDAERILRTSALEGALFVYRLWQAEAEAAWLEVHGTLTVDAAGPSTITLKGSQLINPSQDDTPLENYCETCQIDWAGKRCGSTQATECQYSFQTCQVVERIMVVLNNFEKNFGSATANVAQKVINRRRKI